MRHGSHRLLQGGPDKLMKIDRINLIAFTLSCFLASLAGFAAPIPYATMHVINEGDSGEIITEKAAKVLPRPNQTEWMRPDCTGLQ